jgi:DNA-binding response OmpR family regulator
MNRTILIVEDEADLAASCARLLQRRGWHVEIAGTREAGLAVIARARRPALALVDRQLPDGDGLEVVRAAIAAGTPVIMVSGFGSAGTRQLALDEGAAAFLAKPFSIQELLELVRSILGEPPIGATRGTAPPGCAVPPPSPRWPPEFR